jgi:ribosomal protein S18 acetylase RimI-like enzyme
MNLKIRRLEGNKNEIQIVQQILEETPHYSMNVSGELPDKKAGQEVFSAIPPEFEYKNKHVIGIFKESCPIGVIDLLIGYPIKEKAYIGLLLISEKYQKQGLGLRIYSEIENYLGQFSTIKTVRLSVVESNGNVLKFWEKLGFTKTGEIKPYENKAVRSNAILLEKTVFS